MLGRSLDGAVAWVERRLAFGHAAVVILLAGLVLEALALLHLASGLWFFGDDWDFLLRRGVVGEHERSIWAPHNEHWSTVPILIFRAVFSMVGIGSYLPYAALPIAAHCILWFVLFLAMRRVGVATWPAVVATWIGSWLAAGAGAENTLWDFQIGFVGAAAFGVCALWLSQGERRLTLGLVWASLVLSLMSAGVGLIFVGWVALNVGLRRGAARAAAVAVVPGIVYAVWYLAIGRHVTSTIPTDHTTFPLAMTAGLTAVWTRALGMPGAGPVILLLLAAATVLRRHSAASFALAASGLCALVAAFALFGYSRSGLGIDAGAASRYLYFGMVFCAPALALAVQVAAGQIADRRHVPTLAVGTALLFSLLVGAANADAFAEDRATLTHEARASMGAATKLDSAGEAFLSAAPSPHFNPDVTVTRLHESGADADLGGIHVSARQLLVTRATMQVVVGTTPTLSPTGVPAPVWFKAIHPVARLDHGCQQWQSPSPVGWFELPVGDEGLSFGLRTPANDAVQTALVQGGRVSPPHHWTALPKGDVVVESTARGTRLRVWVPAGLTTICGRAAEGDHVEP